MMPHIKTCFRLLLVLLLAGMVFSACGRKGPPLPPLKQPVVETEAPESQPPPEPAPTPEQKDSEQPPAVPPYP